MPPTWVTRAGSPTFGNDNTSCWGRWQPSLTAHPGTSWCRTQPRSQDAGCEANRYHAGRDCGCSRWLFEMPLHKTHWLELCWVLLRGRCCMAGVASPRPAAAAPRAEVQGPTPQRLAPVPRCGSTITHPGHGWVPQPHARSVPRTLPLPLAPLQGPLGTAPLSVPGVQRPPLPDRRGRRSRGGHGPRLAAASYSPSTQEGAARVVPATCPGKQEHFTVWERSSILFLLQHRWAAMTSHVPGSTCTAGGEAAPVTWGSAAGHRESPARQRGPGPRRPPQGCCWRPRARPSIPPAPLEGEALVLHPTSCTWALTPAPRTRPSYPAHSIASCHGQAKSFIEINEHINGSW